MVIFNAKIYTMDSDVIENGYVEVADGKIVSVGTDYLSPAADDINAQGGILLPGFIDAHTHLGIIENGLTFEGDDCNEMSDPFTPQMRAIDAINPFDHCFEEAWARGITTVLITPGSANAVCGEMIAVKTYGRRIDDMCIGKVGMKFALGENPKTVYNDKEQSPVTRMATAAIIRDGLYKAQKYYKSLTEYKNDEENLDPPEYDIKSEALIPVINRTIKAHFHCHRADDIFTAIRISREFNLDLILIHATEGYLIADILADESIPAIVGPVICDRSKPELKEHNIKNASELCKSGVKISICTDHPVLPIQYLPTSALVCMKGGLSYENAIKALTLNAAEIIGISEKVGSISVGKDADIQLYPSSCANVLDVLSEPMLVMINGKIIKN
jgi:imidazolonepropionase-like amidohydrolase